MDCPEQIAARVKAVLTETPEQRRERVIQEFMAANGYDRIEATAPDGRRVVHLSPAEKQRRFGPLQNEARLHLARLEAERLRVEAKTAAQEPTHDRPYGHYPDRTRF
jgi:hypothetical protein